MIPLKLDTDDNNNSNEIKKRKLFPSPSLTLLDNPFMSSMILLLVVWEGVLTSAFRITQKNMMSQAGLYLHILMSHIFSLHACLPIVLVKL